MRADDECATTQRQGAGRVEAHRAQAPSLKCPTEGACSRSRPAGSGIVSAYGCLSLFRAVVEVSSTSPWGTFLATNSKSSRDWELECPPQAPGALAGRAPGPARLSVTPTVAVVLAAGDIETYGRLAMGRYRYLTVHSSCVDTRHNSEWQGFVTVAVTSK